jgi:hypothetical protein
MKLFVKTIVESNILLLSWIEPSLNSLFEDKEIANYLSEYFKVNIESIEEFPFLNNKKEYAITTSFNHINDIEFLIEALILSAKAVLGEDLVVSRLFKRKESYSSFLPVTTFNNPKLVYIGRV